jgi:hypothetical protein
VLAIAEVIDSVSRVYYLNKLYRYNITYNIVFAYNLPIERFHEPKKYATALDLTFIR